MRAVPFGSLNSVSMRCSQIPSWKSPVLIASLIAPYPELQEQYLQQLIADNQRQKLCNHLRKHLGQEKGLALYNEIKKRAWH